MIDGRAAAMQWRQAARAVLSVAAIGADIAAVAGFLALPWAEGRGWLSGRSFAGPALARLLQNTDVVLGGWSGGAVAALLVGSLLTAPTAALTAAVLAGGSPLAHRPHRAMAVAALLSAVSAILALLLYLVVWASGWLAGAPLVTNPVLPGSLVAGLAAALAALLALAARRRLPVRP